MLFLQLVNESGIAEFECWAGNSIQYSLWRMCLKQAHEYIFIPNDIETILIEVDSIEEFHAWFIYYYFEHIL